MGFRNLHVSCIRALSATMKAAILSTTIDNISEYLRMLDANIDTDIGLTIGPK